MEGGGERDIEIEGLEGGRGKRGGNNVSGGGRRAKRGGGGRREGRMGEVYRVGQITYFFYG